MLQATDYITGDQIEYAGKPHIIRSIDFSTNEATLEMLTGVAWQFSFVTVKIGTYKKFLDLALFREVLNRKVQYVAPRVAKTGKFKLSKHLLAYLQSQVSALFA